MISKSMFSFICVLFLLSYCNMYLKTEAVDEPRYQHPDRDF